MGILSWIIFPAVSPDFNSDPLGAGVTRFVLLLIGFLNTPRDPKTGETRRKLWLWVIPFLIGISYGNLP
jgi:hypothetical protein